MVFPSRAQPVYGFPLGSQDVYVAGVGKRLQVPVDGCQADAAAGAVQPGVKLTRRPEPLDLTQEANERASLAGIPGCAGGGGVHDLTRTPPGPP